MADAAEQLLVQLKAAASGTDGKNAPQLLHAAAESLTALLAELSAVKADQEQQLVRPSAWANRELKYKQDIQEMKRQVTTMEEAQIRLKEELVQARNGTLVQQLKKEIKTLEASNAELKSVRNELMVKYNDLVAKNHELANSSTQAWTAWRDITSVKQVASAFDHTPAPNPPTHSLNHSANGSMHSDAGLISPTEASTDVPATPTPGRNAVIVVEHLSVSGAKAKLAHAQQLHAQSSIPHAPLHSHSSLDRRSTASGDAIGAAGNAANARAAAASGDDSDGKVADLDDLLRDDDAVATITPTDRCLDASAQTTRECAGITGGAQGGVTQIVLDAATETDADFWALTRTPSMGEVAGAAAAAGKGGAGTGKEVTLLDAETQFAPVQAAAAVQATRESADGAAQTDAAPAAAHSAVQAVPETAESQCQWEDEAAGVSVSDRVLPVEAHTQTPTPFLTDTATQSVIAAVAELAVQTSVPERALADVETNVAGVDAYVSQEPPAITPATQTELEERVRAAETALTSAQQDAAAALAAAAAAESALDATRAELAAAQTERAAAAGRLQELETHVTELQSLCEAQRSELAAHKSDLAARESELEAHKGELAAHKSELEATKSEVVAVRESQKARDLQLHAHEAITVRVVELERSLEQRTAELEEARAAAERSAQALVSAQEQLTSLQQAMDAKDKEMEALRLKQDRMQLTMQAYEHTLTSLKEAVEEADVARQIQEVQQVEMAEKLAHMTEFIAVMPKNSKSPDLPTFLRAKQAKQQQAQQAATPPSGTPKHASGGDTKPTVAKSASSQSVTTAK